MKTSHGYFIWYYQEASLKIRLRKCGVTVASAKFVSEVLEAVKALMAPTGVWEGSSFVGAIVRATGYNEAGIRTVLRAFRALGIISEPVRLPNRKFTDAVIRYRWVLLVPDAELEWVNGGLQLKQAP